MKKLIALLIAGLMSASIISACTQPETTETTTNTDLYTTTTVVAEKTVSGTVTGTGKGRLGRHNQSANYFLYLETDDGVMRFYDHKDALIKKIEKGDKVEILYDRKVFRTTRSTGYTVDENGFTRYETKFARWYLLKGIKFLDK